MVARSWAVAASTVLGVTVLSVTACTTGGSDQGTPGGSITTVITSTTAPTTSAIPGGELVAPTLDIAWVEVFSGTSDEDEIDGVAAGEDGASFVTGKFEGRATLGGEELVSAGQADIPFARFEPDGDVSWVQSFGGIGEDNLFDVVATPGGGVVATGWFSDVVEFGSTTLTSSGVRDCVVVSIADDGAVRWARSYGGPLADGCNEVDVVPGGGIVTSIDTAGGWTPFGGDPLPVSGRRSTVLLRLDDDGLPVWTAAVTGPGSPRGKSLSAAADGSVSFGGDTGGRIDVGGTSVAVPGAQRDAWLSRWSPDGTFEWAQAWGGPGDDLAKGVVEDGDSVYVVGAFTGTVEVGGADLSSAGGVDLAVVALDTDGRARWATSVSAPGPVGGAEAVSAPGGGIMFGTQFSPGTQFGVAPGGDVQAEPIADGAAWLAVYDRDGNAVVRTVDGASNGRVGELARRGDRVHLDLTLRGAGNSSGGSALQVLGRKDSSLWVVDLTG